LQPEGPDLNFWNKGKLEYWNIGLKLEAEFNYEEKVHSKVSSPDETAADVYTGPGRPQEKNRMHTV
jgi:hypothetical protein